MNNAAYIPTLTVLVVEDCEADLELYERVLRLDTECSYQILSTCSKKEALQLYGDHRPDCVLLDYNLPGFTGLELLTQLHQQYPQHPVVPIMLTGGVDEQLARQALQLGVKEYLSKDDVNSDSLRIAIHGAIRRATLEKDVQNREGELEHALKKAEEASMAKSEFLANMSHEIRTPLNGVVGFLDILDESEKDPEKKEYLRLARASATHLLGLINDILDFSKIEARELSLEQIPLSISDTIEEAIACCLPQLGMKAIEIVSSMAADVPAVVVGDPSRVKQILINLIGNAIKFTPESGGIGLRVDVEELGSDTVTLKFAVTDSGIGISQDVRDRIFQAFSQADTSTTREYGGTGLGLSIAAKLVALMGGEIWVESIVNVGSVFHFTLELGMGTDLKLGQEPGPDALATDSPTPQSLSILVAEDNRVNQKLIQTILEKRGHTVVLAEHGKDALGMLDRICFDVILMDVHMPEMDGIEATQQLRAKEQGTNRHIPVIALTANALAGDRERFLAAGMDGYVSKPIDQTELFKAISTVLRQ